MQIYRISTFYLLFDKSSVNLKQNYLSRLEIMKLDLINVPCFVSGGGGGSRAIVSANGHASRGVNSRFKRCRCPCTRSYTMFCICRRR